MRVFLKKIGIFGKRERIIGRPLSILCPLSYGMPYRKHAAHSDVYVAVRPFVHLDAKLKQVDYLPVNSHTLTARGIDCG